MGRKATGTVPVSHRAIVDGVERALRRQSRPTHIVVIPSDEEVVGGPWFARRVRKTIKQQARADARMMSCAELEQLARELDVLRPDETIVYGLRLPKSEED